jgi:hypothetical protein
VSGDDVLWAVEVELVGWRKWRRTLALRNLLAMDSDVVRVLGVPLIESILQSRTGARTVKIVVLADSPGEASRKAKAIVSRALSEINDAVEARPWIISTGGSRPVDPPPVE